MGKSGLRSGSPKGGDARTGPDRCGDELVVLQQDSWRSMSITGCYVHLRARIKEVVGLVGASSVGADSIDLSCALQGNGATWWKTGMERDC